MAAQAPNMQGLMQALAQLQQSNALMAQRKEAEMERQRQRRAQTIRAIGTIAGGIYGGPLGAQIGSTAGGLIAGDSSPGEVANTANSWYQQVQIGKQEKENEAANKMLTDDRLRGLQEEQNYLAEYLSKAASEKDKVSQRALDNRNTAVSDYLSNNLPGGTVTKNTIPLEQYEPAGYTPEETAQYSAPAVSRDEAVYAMQNYRPQYTEEEQASLAQINPVMEQITNKFQKNQAVLDLVKGLSQSKQDPSRVASILDVLAGPKASSVAGQPIASKALSWEQIGGGGGAKNPPASETTWLNIMDDTTGEVVDTVYGATAAKNRIDELKTTKKGSYTPTTLVAPQSEEVGIKLGAVNNEIIKNYNEENNEEAVNVSNDALKTVIGTPSASESLRRDLEREEARKEKISLMRNKKDLPTEIRKLEKSDKNASQYERAYYYVADEYPDVDQVPEDFSTGEKAIQAGRNAGAKIITDKLVNEYEAAPKEADSRPSLPYLYSHRSKAMKLLDTESGKFYIKQLDGWIKDKERYLLSDKREKKNDAQNTLAIHNAMEKELATYVVAENAYNFLKQHTDETGANDLAFIYSYMKMLDPESVVRESESKFPYEFSSLWEKAKVKLSGIMTGSKLTREQKLKMLKEAEQRMNEVIKPQMEKTENFYRNFAKVYGKDFSTISKKESFEISKKNAYLKYGKKVDDQFEENYKGDDKKNKTVLGIRSDRLK